MAAQERAGAPERGRAFRALHEAGTFLIPNPWDAGSARLLEALGFPALATTSSGFAYSLGRRDGRVSLAETVEHVRAIVAVTDVPLSVDLENGYGASPEAAAAAVVAVAEAGAVGGSIEDFDPGGEGIYPFEAAVERVAAAVEAAKRLPFPFTLTARAENLIRGHADLDDTIARLAAYERVGADVLYAPGLRDAEQVRTVCSAVSRPVNVLAHRRLTVADVAAAGARRISVGGSLAWVAAGALLEAATELRDQVTFTAFARAPGMARINELLGD